MSRVLIVDDEPGVRSSLMGVLRDEGYDVESAESGEACLDKAGRRAFDVIVLDIWLPGMDGLVTLTRLRERQVDAQIVVRRPCWSCATRFASGTWKRRTATSEHASIAGRPWWATATP